MTLDVTKLKFVPDVIWASPVCQSYSIMGGGKNRTKADMAPKTPAAELGRSLLIKTVAIINHFIKVRHLYIIQSLTTV